MIKRNTLNKVTLLLFCILLITTIYAQETPETPLNENNIPEDYEIVENPDGSTTIRNNGEPEEPFIVEGEEFKLAIGSQITVSADHREYNLLGSGDITLNGVPLKGIQDGVIRTNEEGNIVYADFLAPKGGEYYFEHEGIPYIFVANKDGRIVFNPLENTITGENTELIYENSHITAKEFSIEIDEEGNIKKVTLDKTGEFHHNGKTFSSNKEFNIYLDGRKITDETNAISINNNKVEIKGLVEMNNGINYKPLSPDALTELNLENNLFDVKQGDVRLSNEKHAVLIKDGIAKLEFENLNSKEDAESFKYKHTNKYGFEEYGHLDEIKGNFLLSTDINGQIKVKAMPFSQLEAIMQESSDIEHKISQLETQLDYLEVIGATEEEKTNLKAEILTSNNIKLASEGKIDDAIKATEDFLRESRIKGGKEDYVKISLAELKIERALEYSKIFSQATPEELMEHTKSGLIRRGREDLKESIETLQSIKNSAIGDDNQDLFESSASVLAQTYLRRGSYKEAAMEYRGIAIKTESESLKSNAYRLAGFSEIQNGNIATAMQEYAKALEIDPANEQAKNEFSQLRVNSLTNILNGLGTQGRDLYKLYEEKIGLSTINDGSSLLTDPINSLDNAVFNTRRVYLMMLDYFRDETEANPIFRELEGKQLDISQQQKGVLALLALERDGIDLPEFYASRPSKRLDMIQQATGFDRDLARKWSIAAQVLRNQNSDIALMLTNGNYAQASELISDATPEFKFRTGEGYVDPGLLQTTWKDTLLNQLNLANAALFLAPEGLITAGGKSLTVGGWTVRGTSALLSKSSSGARVLSTLAKIGEVPGIKSGITKAGAELAAGAALAQIAPSYAVEIMSVFGGRLGIKGISGVGNKVSALVTSSDEIIPLLRVTKKQKFNLLKNAKHLGENLFEIDGKRTAIAVNNEVIETVGDSRVLREFDLRKTDSTLDKALQLTQRKTSNAAKNPRGVWVYDEITDSRAFITTEKRTKPLGFKSEKTWDQYREHATSKIQKAQEELARHGVTTEIKVGLQGSAATGVSSKTGQFTTLPGDYDFLVTNNQLFDLVMDRAEEKARRGLLVIEGKGGGSIEEQLAYVAKFRERGIALLHDKTLLPELSKDMLHSAPHMQPGIKPNIMVSRSNSVAANKHTILVNQFLIFARTLFK
jgi:tetratricopeptide (TPR) repeat protein